MKVNIFTKTLANIFDLQSFMLLLKFGTKPKFLHEEIMQLTFKALALDQY